MTKGNHPYPGKGTAGRRRTAPLVVLLVLAAVLGAWWVQSSLAETPAAQYAAAVADAVTAEPAELEPLVELTPADPRTTWDGQGRVLLLSWHSQPEQYPAGEELCLTDGALWTFTDQEFFGWYETHKAGVTDWTLRLEQLIGLPPETGYTHVSGFWVDPAQVLRPAYVTDVTAQMALDFPPGTDPAFRTWFADNAAFSYEESAYPWTRLGYTYDWADNGTAYGLTEFLVQEGAAVEVAFTASTEDFLATLDQGTPLQ